jgi:hypothetical protein
MVKSHSQHQLPRPNIHIQKHSIWLINWGNSKSPWPNTASDSFVYPGPISVLNESLLKVYGRRYLLGMTFSHPASIFPLFQLSCTHMTDSTFNDQFSTFSFLEFRSSCLLGRHSNTWAMPPAFYILNIKIIINPQEMAKVMQKVPLSSFPNFLPMVTSYIHACDIIYIYYIYKINTRLIGSLQLSILLMFIFQQQFQRPGM